jgi:transmembrane sensor
VVVQANQTVTLQAGQQTVYDYERIHAVQRPNLDQVSSWRRGYLAFDGQPLADVVEELNRYRPGKIVVYSDSLKSRPVYLSLSISDMDLALDMLRAMSGIRVQELAGGIALVRQT